MQKQSWKQCGDRVSQNNVQRAKMRGAQQGQRKEINSVSGCTCEIASSQGGTRAIKKVQLWRDGIIDVLWARKQYLQ